MGRSTEAPKNNRESFRLSDDDMKKLKFCMERTSMSKTDIVRKGIDLVYQETANQWSVTALRSCEHSVFIHSKKIYDDSDT